MTKIGKNFDSEAYNKVNLKGTSEVLDDKSIILRQSSERKNEHYLLNTL